MSVLRTVFWEELIDTCDNILLTSFCDTNLAHSWDYKRKRRVHVFLLIVSLGPWLVQNEIYDTTLSYWSVCGTSKLEIKILDSLEDDCNLLLKYASQSSFPITNSQLIMTLLQRRTFQGPQKMDGRAKYRGQARDERCEQGAS